MLETSLILGLIETSVRRNHVIIGKLYSFAQQSILSKNQNRFKFPPRLNLFKSYSGMDFPSKYFLLAVLNN